jgi:hypothetical protein
MGGLEPPIHPACVARWRRFHSVADARAMDGRVQLGHDDMRAFPQEKSRL